MVGQNGNKTAGKYLKFELVLANAGRTTIPTEEEVGLSDDSVKKLEEEYKAHYGCKRENDYWVCKP